MAFPLVGAMMMAPAAMGLFSMFGGGGLGSCCSGMLGSPGQGALAGGLAGGLTGFLFSGGNPIGGLIGGGIGAALGALIGRHNQHHHHHHHHHGHCHNFPPPCGGGYGGPHCGGYNPGFGPGFPGAYPGGYPGGAYNQGYQAGYQQGQYNAGYQAGYQAGMQGYGGYPPQGGYPGCFPPGGGWNQGCPPHNHCHPPRCGSTGNPGGHLCQEGPGKPINYTTSGGWKVQVNGDKVICTSPDGKQKIEHSGDPHEYVNGKHIKDWEGKQRSMVLPDGTKITMGASGPQGLVENTSIYDGDQNIQIQNKGNEITHRSFNPYDTRMREAYQYDGETSGVRYNNRGGIDYTNYYTQDENFGVRSNHKDLASVQDPKWYERPILPFWGIGQQRTRDYYNDPRLLFT